MNTITTVLQPHEDGTLHLPVPTAWRNQAIRVKAELELVASGTEPSPKEPLKGFGCLRGKISMSPDFDEPLEDFKEYMA
jgi:hypothetical protein